jgi:hypothetical protein
MKLGIMQPYFFPYLGYFHLIASTDRWIIFDVVQYIRHGWVNRNRILHPSSGWQYVIVPLRKHKRETLIQDVQVNNEIPWREKMLGQLAHYRKKAPYYHETTLLVANALDYDGDSLVELNRRCLSAVCGYLGIQFHAEVLSLMELDVAENVDGPGDWALEIAGALGASEYVNPRGGADLFDAARFQSRGVRLTIQEFSNLQYSCRGYLFEPDLSILDVLMWQAPETVREHLLAQV